MLRSGDHGAACVADNIESGAIVGGAVVVRAVDGVVDNGLDGGGVFVLVGPVRDSGVTVAPLLQSIRSARRSCFAAPLALTFQAYARCTSARSLSTGD